MGRHPDDDSAVVSGSSHHSRVRFIRDGAVAHVTLARPHQRNSIDLKMAESLLEVVLRCSGEPGIRAVLLDGEGPSFCVGGDLASFASESERLPAHLREVATNLHAAQGALTRLGVPLVVAVHGAAAGAGLGLACLGDIVLAAESARFVFGYPAIGLTPDAGGTWILPRLIGLRRFLDLVLSNRAVTAREAVDIGLITQVVPDSDLAGTAFDAVRALAEGPTHAFGATKRLLQSSWARSYEEQLAAECEALQDAAATVDSGEGISAFLERRSANFRGF